MFLTLEGIVSYIFIHTFILRLFFFIFIQHIKGVRLKKCIQSICLWAVKVRLDTSILPYKMHYQEIICLQFARIYIFLTAKEKQAGHTRGVQHRKSRTLGITHF